jgi:hypothetical protein
MEIEVNFRYGVEETGKKPVPSFKNGIKGP